MNKRIFLTMIIVLIFSINAAALNVDLSNTKTKIMEGAALAVNINGSAADSGKHLKTFTATVKGFKAKYSDSNPSVRLVFGTNDLYSFSRDAGLFSYGITDFTIISAAKKGDVGTWTIEVTATQTDGKTSSSTIQIVVDDNPFSSFFDKTLAAVFGKPNPRSVLQNPTDYVVPELRALNKSSDEVAQNILDNCKPYTPSTDSDTLSRLIVSSCKSTNTSSDSTRVDAAAKLIIDQCNIRNSPQAQEISRQIEQNCSNENFYSEGFGGASGQGPTTAAQMNKAINDSMNSKYDSKIVQAFDSAIKSSAASSGSCKVDNTAIVYPVKLSSISCGDSDASSKIVAAECNLGSNVSPSKVSETTQKFKDICEKASPNNSPNVVSQNLKIIESLTAGVSASPDTVNCKINNIAGVSPLTMASVNCDSSASSDSVNAGTKHIASQCNLGIVPPAIVEQVKNELTIACNDSSTADTSGTNSDSFKAVTDSLATAVEESTTTQASASTPEVTPQVTPKKLEPNLDVGSGQVKVGEPMSVTINPSTPTETGKKLKYKLEFFSYSGNSETNLKISKTVNDEIWIFFNNDDITTPQIVQLSTKTNEADIGTWKFKLVVTQDNGETAEITKSINVMPKSNSVVAVNPPIESAPTPNPPQQVASSAKASLKGTFSPVVEEQPMYLDVTNSLPENGKTITKYLIMVKSFTKGSSASGTPSKTVGSTYPFVPSNIEVQLDGKKLIKFIYATTKGDIGIWVFSLSLEQGDKQ